jgi:hypothetical protein
MAKASRAGKAAAGGPDDVYVIGERGRFTPFRQVNEGVIGIQEFPAINGGKASRHELAEAGILAADAPYDTAAIGTLLSHLSLWKMAVVEDRPLTICRDNAVFNNKFAATHDVLLGFCRDRFDIVYWGWNFNAALKYDLMACGIQSVLFCDQWSSSDLLARFKQIDIYPAIYKLHEIYGLVCYTVSPKGARKLIERVLPVKAASVVSASSRRPVPNIGIDVSMNGIHSQIDSLVCIPPLVAAPNDEPAHKPNALGRTSRRSSGNSYMIG